MALLKKLKSMLGIGTGSERDRRVDDTEVTVERDTRASDAGRSARDDAVTEETSVESEATAEPGEVASEGEVADEPEGGAAAADEEAGGETPLDSASADEPVGAEPGEAPGPEAETTVTDAETEIPEVEEEEAATAEPETSEVEETDLESAEGADLESAEETSDVESGEPEAEAADDAGDEPVDTVRGIGPAYAERLAEIDITTVGDLLAADPDEVAEETAVSEKRVRAWVDRARKEN